MTPERLGRFEVEGILGEGGMGTVYAARDSDSGEPVALKVLFSSLVEDNAKFLRFEQEVAALSRLSHPGIVGLLGPLQREGDRVFFPMELIEGETLSAFLRREGALTVPAALRIVRPVIEALGAAHDSGVVHRDVKPSNILLTGGSVKVTDFGLARMDDVTRLTQTGQIMGTLDYMSPEQVDGAVVDGRSDLYSVGILIFELLTGKPPFHRPTPGAVLKGHLTDSPTRLERIRSDLPPGLSDIVDRLLAKRPEERFADARETLAALGAVVDGPETISFYPEQPDEEEDEEDEPSVAIPIATGRPWLAPLAVGAALLVGAAAFLAFRGSGDKPPAAPDPTPEARRENSRERPGPGLRLAEARQRRVIYGRVKEFFAGLDLRGPEMLNRMEKAGLLDRREKEACLGRLREVLARGRVEFRIIEEKSKFDATRAEVMVRCRALAEVLSHDDDGFLVWFRRSGRDRKWRPMGIRRAGS